MKKPIVRLIATCLSAVMGITGLASNALAAPQEQNIVTDPSNQDFTSLNKHAIPTHIENVYKVQVRVEPPVAKTPPVYVALILDASGSMATNGQDIWNAATNSWITRLDAVKGATQKAIDTLYAESQKPQGPQDIYVNIVSYTHLYGNGVKSLTSGFEPILDSSKKLLPKFQKLDNGAGSVLGDPASGYQSGGGTEMFSGLQKIYTDMLTTSIPENASRYVLLLTDGNEWDVDKTLTQKYAAALKAPFGQALPAQFSTPGAISGNTYSLVPMTKGMGATIWSIVVGHGINMRPLDWEAQWNTNYHNDATLNGFTPSSLTSTGIISNGFTAWDKWSPNISAADPLLRKVPTSPASANKYVLFQEDFGSAEMNMIMASIDIKNSYVTFPSITDVNNMGIIRDWYLANGVSTIANGTNAHYYFSMSVDGQNPSGYSDGDSIASLPNVDSYGLYNYGHPSGIDGVFNDFAVAASKVKRTDVIVNDSINSYAFDIYQMPGEPRIAVYSDDPEQPVMELKESNGKIQWNLTELNPSYVYTMVYYIKLNPDPSAGPNAYYPLELDPSYISYTNTQGTKTIKHFPVTQIQADKWESSQTSSSVGGNVMVSIDQQGKTIDGSGNVMTTISSSTNTAITNSSDAVLTGGGGFISAPQPYKASVANPNVGKKKSSSTSKTTTPTVESIDEAATKANKGKKLTTITAKTPVYYEPKEDSDIVLLLTKGRTFKIVSVTKNYYMIQYKKKDGKVYKGYILKKDAKIN